MPDPILREYTRPMGDGEKVEQYERYRGINEEIESLVDHRSMTVKDINAQIKRHKASAAQQLKDIDAGVVREVVPCGVEYNSPDKGQKRYFRSDKKKPGGHKIYVGDPQPMTKEDFQALQAMLPGMDEGDGPGDPEDYQNVFLGHLIGLKVGESEGVEFLDLCLGDPAKDEPDGLFIRMVIDENENFDLIMAMNEGHPELLSGRAAIPNGNSDWPELWFSIPAEWSERLSALRAKHADPGVPNHQVLADYHELCLEAGLIDAEPVEPVEPVGAEQAAA